MGKNKFLTFVFSIIPGCGFMYLGYMKRGLQFLLMFSAFAFLGVICFKGNFGSMTNGMITLFFWLFLPIIWLYQMFDSMHTISHMKRLEIIYPEDDGFFIPGVSHIENLDALNFFKKPKVVKTFAVIFICAGLYMLFLNASEWIFSIIITYTNYEVQEMYYYSYNMLMQYITPVVISVVLIFAGIKLLAGNKKISRSQNSKNSPNNSDNQIGESNEINEISEK